MTAISLDQSGGRRGRHGPKKHPFKKLGKWLKGHIKLKPSMGLKLLAGGLKVAGGIASLAPGGAIWSKGLKFVGNLAAKGGQHLHQRGHGMDGAGLIGEGIGSGYITVQDGEGKKIKMKFHKAKQWLSDFFHGRKKIHPRHLVRAGKILVHAYKNRHELKRKLKAGDLKGLASSVKDIRRKSRQETHQIMKTARKGVRQARKVAKAAKSKNLKKLASSLQETRAMIPMKHKAKAAKAISKTKLGKSKWGQVATQALNKKVAPAATPAASNPNAHVGGGLRVGRGYSKSMKLLSLPRSSTRRKGSGLRTGAGRKKRKKKNPAATNPCKHPNYR